MTDLSNATRPLAAVTGASSGIGRELAKQFAAHGFDVIIAAEDADLDGARQVLEGLGARVIAVRTDLATREGVDELWSAISGAGRPLDAIALNAGVGNAGPFVDTALDDDLRLIDLNIGHVVHLAKHVGKAMSIHGRGRILFTSSVAASMPGPYYATYAASKAFVQSFAEALRSELADSGVTVTALQPGPTETEFFDRANMDGTKVGESDSKDSAADVARDGFEAMMAGKDHVVAGSAMNRLQTALGTFLPEPIAAKLHGSMLAEK